MKSKLVKNLVTDSMMVENKIDPTAGMETGIRELTEEETQAVSGGNNAAAIGTIIRIAIEGARRIDGNTFRDSGVVRENPGGFGSDSRIKEDIEKVGFDPTNEVDIYSWRYKNEDQTRYVGVMAQELLGRKDLASSVGIATDGQFKGFYAVNYSKLGLKMTTEQNWNQGGLASLRAA